MAFFKFRWPGKQRPADGGKPARRSARAPQPPAPSIEEMRRRARHRLIGAAVLVLAAIVGFPLVFDTQPRPIPVNVAIDIPDRHKVAPLVVPQPATDAEQPAGAPPAAAGLDDGEELLSTAAPTPSAAPAPAATAKPADKTPAAPESRPASAPPAPQEPRAEARAEPPVRAEAKAEPKPAPEPARPEPRPARADEAARARALLEGRDPVAAVAAAASPAAAAPRTETPDAGRFVVQVGAFADTAKAQETRERLERAGLKTYTQVVQTKDGARTRVRLGPFGSRAEAERAAERARGAGLAGTVLAL